MLQSSLRLTRINLKNFKAFDETSVSFPQKINLIMGENSSGKSSIIKSIIAMKQTFSVTNEYEVFAANGDYVELGIYGDREFNFEVQFPIKNQAAFRSSSKTTCG
ncbi:AAA family ATPase, partial [Aeromonas caviae]